MLARGLVFFGALFMVTVVGARYRVFVVPKTGVYQAAIFDPFKFATDFYTAARDEDPTGNVILSPLSVQTVLALLLMGADGNTKEQIVTGLQLRTDNRSTIANYFRELLSDSPVSGVLKTANKVYTGTGYSVHPEFNSLYANSFKVEVDSANFAEPARAAQAINSWVEEHTDNKIRSAFSPKDFNSDTRMVLVNTVLFKAAWKDSFPKTNTKKADFWISETESVEVDMMHIMVPIMYGRIQELDAKVGLLPYKDTGLDMMIILPNSRTGLDELESKLRTFDFSKLGRLLHRTRTEISLPRFQIETTVDLQTVLTKLGMADMFSDGANFRGLIDSEYVKIDTAIHKAFIKVDEEGTEATAGTGSIIIPLSAMGPPVLNIDHPFFFVIGSRDVAAFVGSVRHL